ncbi:hypothetical protein NUW58_g3738 [Xylaria curta]|uniref:Uncharacterized protein n=1 Tax=Xylaria curta TaxID=42375 RepID=A0ACC1PB26_9PEZI|nr:hypothetical protein NUW58_g3738 [Xylaria curta]
MDRETDNGSQSASDKLEFGGSETTISTIGGSHVALNSSDSKTPLESEDKVAGNLKYAEGKHPQVKVETDEDKPEEPNEATPNNEVPRRSKKKRVVESESSDTSEDDEFSGYEDKAAMRKTWVRRLTRRHDAKTIFAAYEASVEKRSNRKDRKNQGPALVDGLVDFLRVLETRISKLESGTALKSTANTTEQEKDTNSNPVDGDETTILSSRFFNSTYDLAENGGYLGVHEGAERGTYMCDRDPKYLIRALYSWTNENAKQLSDSPTCEPLNPNDIDIITFGVHSEPIATFFEKELDVDLTGHLIRFEKPFRPVIRNIDRIKEHLLKLETKFGRVAGNVEQPCPSTPEANVEYKEDDPPSLLPDSEESIKAFDKPAALPHFEHFVAFVDNYLSKQIQLYARLRDAKEERVAFENLWMLFDSKDTIYCPLREVSQGEVLYAAEGDNHEPVRRHTPQAYRVIATAGGTPLEKSLASTDKLGFVNPTMTEQGLDLQGVQFVLPGVVLPVATMSRKIRNNYNELYVYCFYVDFNGLAYGVVREVFVFKPYEGEMDIRSLQAYPIEYATNHTLLDRGKTFLQLTKVSHKRYEGLTTGPNREEINSPVIVDIKLAFEGDQGLEKQSIEVPKFDSISGFWLDHLYDGLCDVTSKASCSNIWCHNRSCISNVYIKSQKKLREAYESEIKPVLEEYETLKHHSGAGRKRFRHLMENKDLVILLPGAVPGFALRNRRWVLLDINSVKDVEKDSSTLAIPTDSRNSSKLFCPYVDITDFGVINSEWKNLFLPSGHQAMVQAMVETHTSDKDGKKGMDLVRGKGKGCIILLHGVPGVGKTSTAECVAAHTKKPLYPITCGDIGYNPEDVERNMETHFKLAHRWGCVLLLDEADVFLAKRDQKDVQRNGLVSVFLRILEYYSGILFLTTNRVGAIDDAFRSRLHLTLYYPKLTKTQTNEIFTHNFTRIADINSERKKKGLPPFEYTESEDEILGWAKKNYKALSWNGRQIRNAFQTVLALSEFHAKSKSKKLDKPTSPVVKLKHFKVVANAAIQFNEYLKATHGYDEERVAKRDFIRAVEFSPKSSLFSDETGDSSDQNSSEADTSESDDSQSDTRADQGDSDDSDSDQKDKGSKSKAKKESSKKTTVKKGKKVKDDKSKPEKKPKDKKKEKKEKKEKEDTDESE